MGYKEDERLASSRTAWQRILSLRLYCVAPLQHGPLPPVTYDFWLVGKDCCRASSPGFNCGSAQHQHSNGLTARRWLSCDIWPLDVRLMEDLTNYKLAVKQVGDSTALSFHGGGSCLWHLGCASALLLPCGGRGGSSLGAFATWPGPGRAGDSSPASFAPILLRLQRSTSFTNTTCRGYLFFQIFVVLLAILFYFPSTQR